MEFYSEAAGVLTLEYTLESILDNPFAPQSDGTYQCSVSQTEDSEALETFLEEFKQVGASATSQTLSYQDGEEDVIAGGSSAKELYVVKYGGKSGEDTVKRSLFIARCIVDGASGGESSSAVNSMSNPPLVIKTVKENHSAGQAFVETLFASALVTVSSPGFTLPSGSYGKKFFAPVP